MENRKINRIQIIEELKEKGYEEKRISYEELQRLYQEYGNGMPEIDFAQNILGISDRNYTNCKNGIVKRTKILNGESKESLEEASEIIEELKEKGYVGKSISYEELQELYRKHGEGMSEKDFAQTVLGISNRNYINCKYKGIRTKVLNKEKLSEEEIQKIIEELSEIVYEGELISYEELQQLYQNYRKIMLEVDFAQSILGISHSSYLDCKNGRSKRVIVHNGKKIQLSEEEIQEIIEELREKGYIGKSILYQELQQLHKEYGREMLEKDFAQTVLGLSYYNYMNCKNKKTRAVIKDGVAYNKAKQIRELYVNKPGYYSKEFIDSICKQYNISIEEFITYVVFNKFYDITPLLNVLNEKNKLWIGKTRISEEFVNKNIDLIQKVARNIVNSLCRRYKIKGKREDYEQELILYIIENMGAEERNFGDNIQLFKSMIYRRAKKYAEYELGLKELKISSKCRQFSSLKIRGKNNKEIQIDIADRSTNTEGKVIENDEKARLVEDEPEQCIQLLSMYIQLDYGREEAIAITAKKMNIDSNTMLEYMKQYLLTKGRVHIRSNGKVELGER